MQKIYSAIEILRCSYWVDSTGC